MKMGKNNVVDGWLCGEQDEKSKLFEHLYFCILTWKMCRETKNTFEYKFIASKNNDNKRWFVAMRLEWKI